MDTSDDSSDERPDSPVGRRRLAEKRLKAAMPRGSELTRPDKAGFFCVAATLPAKRRRCTVHALDHASKARVVVAFATEGRPYDDDMCDRVLLMVKNGVSVVMAPPHGKGVSEWLCNVVEAIASGTERGIVVVADCAETLPLRKRLRQAGGTGKLRRLRTVSVHPCEIKRQWRASASRASRTPHRSRTSRAPASADEW